MIPLTLTMGDWRLIVSAPGGDAGDFDHAISAFTPTRVTTRLFGNDVELSLTQDALALASGVA